MQLNFKVCHFENNDEGKKKIRDRQFLKVLAYSKHTHNELLFVKLFLDGFAVTAKTHNRKTNNI